ncbi:NnrS family protein [Kiloniella antarctica]|uniref:NnrS family protein n=1 Tax=Kiloniella antarctica TaxID=1550907 RepID=A0ABW5BF81_9PROT
MNSNIPAFWRAGFRPFFLSGAFYALLVLCLWILSLTGYLEYETYVAPPLIHGHEMLYGFGVAAIAGFILTAMPNWTNTPPLSGLPLAGLYAFWIAGRLSLWAGTSIPFVVLATVDMLFLPTLAIMTARTLYKAGNKKNLMLPGIFLLLGTFNLLFYLSEMSVIELSSRTILEAAISVLILLITIIGGRIVPAFTRNALHQQGITIEISAPTKLSIACIIGTFVMVLGDVFISPDYPNSFAVFCLLLAMAHFIRLIFWKGWLTLNDPLLWSMHLGYLWIPIGLLLKSYGLYEYGYFWEGALHALTTGAIATMVLVVMIRAGLGHSGSPLKSSFLLTCSLIAITLAALSRVVQSALEGPLSVPVLHSSGLLWTLAFGLYIIHFLPIMFKPRLDGKPG